MYHLYSQILNVLEYVMNESFSELIFQKKGIISECVVCVAGSSIGFNEVLLYNKSFEDLTGCIFR